MNQFLVALFLCIAVATAFPSNTPRKPVLISERSTRITGGEEAAEGQFPWTTAVLVDGSGMCAGALIHPSWVATSAHCVVASTEGTFNVILGALHVSAPDQEVITSEAVVHEGFDADTITNAIALLNIGNDITLTENVQPIPLPTTRTEAGVTLTISGYGETSSMPPGMLRYTEVQTIDNEDCDAVYGDTYIHVETLCTISANDDQGACAGDLGSPLVRNPTNENVTLEALATFLSGEECGPQSLPSGTLRIYEFIFWINDHISG